MDNIIKFQALKRFFCHAVPIPCGRCVAVLKKMLTHRNTIQNIIIFFIAITGLVSSLIRYEMFELLKEAEINNAVTTIIWLCVLYSSITCIYLYCNPFLSNYHNIRQKQIDCLPLLLSGVYGIFAVIAVYQLVHDMFEWHSKVKDIGFPVLYLYYILWISRLIQRVLACTFFVIVYLVTSSWITYTSLETKEHFTQFAPWQIFHYILLLLTLVWTNKERAAFEEIAFFLFAQFFMLIRVLWLGRLLMNIPLLHHPEEDQEKLSDDLIGVVRYSPLAKTELVVRVTSGMTCYPEKIVIGTIGQRFFDVIIPHEKNEKPLEKITQIQIKDQPLEAPNTTTGPQVNALDQNETKVYKPPLDFERDKQSMVDKKKEETITEKDKITKPSDVIHKHHHELCNILDTCEQTLLRFAGKAYSERIIDLPTRLDIQRKMGYRGAAVLLDIIKQRVKTKADLITVLKIMESFEYLESITKDMRYEFYQIEEQRKQHDSHMILDTTPVSSGDIEKAIEGTRQLQNDFIEMTVEIRQLSSGVDVGNLKVRICGLFRCRGYIMEAVQEHLDELQRLTTPDGVLNFLTTRKYLGYLNYELIKLFPKAVKNDENKVQSLNSAIQEYEKKHEEFLSPSSFNTLVEVFKKDDSLAPDSPIGLPEIKIILESEWGGKSIYDWKEFLDKEFLSSWPSHLIIKDICKKCIILTYVVLPFFLPAVLKDLTDLQKLKKHGITVKFSLSATKVVAMRNATTQVLPLQRCIATLNFTPDHIISALNFLSICNLTLHSAIPKRAFFCRASECIENPSNHRCVATPAIEDKELICSSDTVICYGMNDAESKWLEPLPLPPSYTNAPTMDQLIIKLEQVAFTSRKDLLVTIWRLEIIKKNNRGQCYELLMNILKYGGVLVPRIHSYGQLYFVLLENID